MRLAEILSVSLLIAHFKSCSGGQEMGMQEEQAEDELWKVVTRFAILLWQEYHTEDWRKEVDIKWGEFCWQLAPVLGTSTGLSVICRTFLARHRNNSSPGWELYLRGSTKMIDCLFSSTHVQVYNNIMDILFLFILLIKFYLRTK